MWLERLKNIKDSKGISTKMIAQRANLPEFTVRRILAGDTCSPRIDTLCLIIYAIGSSPEEIFANSSSVLANKTMTDLQEEKDRLLAENERLAAELELLRTQAANLMAEKEILREKNESLKDQLIEYFARNLGKNE
jgi:predicted transcriptional regulator